MTRLQGKSALVTGGASGIGAGTVRRFVAEGARVTIADLDEEKGEGLAAELGDKVLFIPTNVTIERDVAEAVARSIEQWGQLDCLFNNAGGGGANGPIASIPVEHFDGTVDVNLKSAFLGMKHIAEHMIARGSGSIINNASVCGLTSGMGPHLYSATKAAVIALTNSVALELGHYGIRVNSICPGTVDTPIFQGNTAILDHFKKLTPIGRVGKPEDLAAMALFLASDESNWVTGQAMVVDGGLSTGIPWDQWAEHLRIPAPIGD
jgi:NAD(P)-dependent dehydrogenase (short-subunit alcohol dehydrogenase family)